jgi:hypothetical protein
MILAMAEAEMRRTPTSHFRKIHPIGFPVGNQGMTLVYQIYKTCICNTENLCMSLVAYVSVPRFSYNHSVSNTPQKDLIPVIAATLLDSMPIHSHWSGAVYPKNGQ